MLRATQDGVSCPCARTLIVGQYTLYLNTIRIDLLGTEYIAAIPARKSRANPLPPVAEADHGP